MISSKELLEQTGISRATLNNYIQLGILPKPNVQSHAGDTAGAARLLGYFPDDAVDRIQTVQALKAKGLSMNLIAQELASTDALLGVGDFSDGLEPVRSAESTQVAAVKAPEYRKTASAPPKKQTMQSSPGMMLSLDRLEQPAYMLNYNLELTWLNEAARTELFCFTTPPAQSSERNLFELFSRPESKLSLSDQRALANLHLHLASARMGKDSLTKVVMSADPDLMDLFVDLKFQTKSQEQQPSSAITELDLIRTGPNGLPMLYRVQCISARESWLFIRHLRIEKMICSRSWVSAIR